MQADRSERGLVGKVTIVWLLLLALIVVAAIDTGSIVITRFHLSSIAANAASDAAAAYGLQHDEQIACDAAAASLQSQDASVKLTKHGCTVDPATGAVTIKVRKEAKTILAGRLSFTRKYANVTDTETNGPPSL